MKENPIRIPEQLTQVFNQITLENHKHKLNIDLGIQLQNIEFSYSKKLKCRNEIQQS